MTGFYTSGKELNGKKVNSNKSNQEIQEITDMFPYMVRILNDGGLLSVLNCLVYLIMTFRGKRKMIHCFRLLVLIINLGNAVRSKKKIQKSLIIFNLDNPSWWGFYEASCNCNGHQFWFNFTMKLNTRSKCCIPN